MITIRVPSPLMIDLRIHDYNAHQFPLLCLNNDDNVVCKSDLYFDDGGKIWTPSFYTMPTCALIMMYMGSM